ncbi:MAG: aminopeptidase P N-terminal domain-containing protein [Planctomycetota bacterium]
MSRLLSLWFVLASAVAQTPVLAPAMLQAPPAPPAPAEFAARRAALARAVAKEHEGRHIVIVLRGGPGRDDMAAFVQDQDFLYLSGVAEPDLALLLVPGADGALAVDELLVPPHSPFTATWNGEFLAPGDAAAQRTGFAAVGDVRALDRRLAQLLEPDADGKQPLLCTALHPAARLGSTPGQAMDAANAQKGDAFDGRPSRAGAFVERLQNDGVPTSKIAVGTIAGIDGALAAMRVHKSPKEQELLRAAAAVAAQGIAEAMRSTRPGMFEYQVAAVARCVFSLRGAGPDAYAAIVGGGPNGCVLHYSACTRQLRDDDLIVMDYAPTLGGYASDVTRTFPASGRFSPAQRKLVQDVHDIQQQLLAMVKPGARISDISRRCKELLFERGYASDHGPCHHVGLAVHDPWCDELAAGMVITVEPGAYLRKQAMGCRIEDTVLVTADGCEILSAAVPSTPDAIEALMQGGTGR